MKHLSCVILILTMFLACTPSEDNPFVGDWNSTLKSIEVRGSIIDSNNVKPIIHFDQNQGHVLWYEGSTDTTFFTYEYTQDSIRLFYTLDTTPVTQYLEFYKFNILNENQIDFSHNRQKTDANGFRSTVVDWKLKRKE